MTDTWYNFTIFTIVTPSVLKQRRIFGNYFTIPKCVSQNHNNVLGFTVLNDIVQYMETR